MKIGSVVNRLAARLPQLSPYFTESVGVMLSFLVPGTFNPNDGRGMQVVRTIGPHGVREGDLVNIKNVKAVEFIDSYTFTDGFLEVSLADNVGHDLTLHPANPEKTYAELGGFFEPEWNGFFELVDVPNRLNFKIATNNTEAPQSNGQLWETISNVFNGPGVAENVTAEEFSIFFQSESDNLRQGIGGTVEKSVRLAGVVDVPRAIEEYTRQDEGKYFMFVVAPLSVTANKSRYASTDINEEQTLATNFNQNIRDGFILLVVANVSSEAGALRAMDTIRDEVFKSILLAVRGFKFDSGLAYEANQVANFLSHGTLAYDSSKYVHQFIFEQPLVLSVDDSAESDTRAFRDIDFMSLELRAEINLDDKPIT